MSGVDYHQVGYLVLLEFVETSQQHDYLAAIFTTSVEWKFRDFLNAFNGNFL